MLEKYSQNYDFYIFYFVSLEVGTAALKIFCVMISSLVDTSLDFGLLRVVRPYLFECLNERRQHFDSLQILKTSVGNV